MRALGKRYVAEMRARLPPGQRNATRIVDKMLRNAWNLGFISTMLPKAHFIHAVRHPLDTVLSCYAQPFEGRGTPWAWDLAGAARLLCLRPVSLSRCSPVALCLSPFAQLAYVAVERIYPWTVVSCLQTLQTRSSSTTT